MSPGEDDRTDPPRPPAIARFPQTRVMPHRQGKDQRDLGTSDLARMLGTPSRQGTGHWCSRCQGIWYGYLLEVTCPKCGNRNG